MLSFKQAMPFKGDPIEVNLEIGKIEGIWCVGGNFEATREAYLKEQEYKKNHPPEPRAIRPYKIEKC